MKLSLPSRLFAAAALLATSAQLAIAAENAALSTALNSIRERELFRHVEVLADDSFEGREAGSRGGRAAAIYLRKLMVEYGLKPGADGGDFFQIFNGRSRNVLGILEGSDPLLKDEFVVVCAHYDHVGYGDRSNSYGPIGFIHNGADDNASGTAVIIEMIEAFSLLEQNPRRSVLFAFWDGEEKGLLGSKHYVAHPTVPLSQTKTLINMDMVGRLRSDKLMVYGTRSAPGSRRLVSQLNSQTDMLLDFTWELKDNSDHFPFFERQVPVVMLHTGLHDDYHRPRDDAHLINAAGMQRVSRLAFSLTYELAQMDATLPYRGQARYETPANQQRLRAPIKPLPKRLGVAWTADTEADGLVLTKIAAGSAAENGGLKVGDRIVRFGGKEMYEGTDLRAAVVVARNPVQVEVARDGSKELVTLSLELAGRPHRLGLSWRSDIAEPGTAIVKSVVPDSPAARAGLRSDDRIYQIGGRDFADTNELLSLAKSLPEPVELLIERQGRMSSVTLDNLILPGQVDSVIGE